MKNILFLFVYSLLFSQQSKSALTNDLLINLKLDREDKVIVFNHNYVIVIQTENKKILAKKICGSKIIYSQEVNPVDYEKCLNAFSELSNINPVHLDIQKNEKEEIIIIPDGFNIKIELFYDGKNTVLNSYSPQEDIDAKFPFFEERQLYINIYKELFKFFYNEEYENLKKTDSLYIYVNKSIKYSNPIYQDTLKNKRQENYFIQFDCASIQFLNFNRNDYKVPENSNYLSKSYLKKKKEKIVNVHFLNQFLECELQQLLENKTIYIIDESKKKNKKFLVTEFSGGTSCF